MSDLNITLDAKQILRRTEPVQSCFIAVRFNANTGKTLLDRATMSKTQEETRRLAEAGSSPHRCVRIVRLNTRVVRVMDTPAGMTRMVEVEPQEDEENDNY